MIGKTASCAAMALTFASYAVPNTWWFQRLVAVAAVAALAALNYRGISRTAALTRLLVGAVLLVLGGFAVAVVVAGHPSVHRLTGAGGSGGLFAAGWYGTLQAGGLMFFALAGYARIATLGEEVREPRRTIPRAIPLALAITVAVYAVIAVLLLATAGPARIAGSHTPLTTAAHDAGLDAFGPVLRIGAALASLGALLALIAGIGRTTLAMARHHDLPAWLGAIHPRFRVPHRAEVVLAGVVIVLVLSTDLRGVIAFSSFGVLLYYGIANAAAYTQPAGQRRWPRGLNVLGAAGCLLLAGTLPWTAVVTGIAILAVGLTGRVLACRRSRPAHQDR